MRPGIGAAWQPLDARANLECIVACPDGRRDTPAANVHALRQYIESLSV